ncbi:MULTISPECIES: hypothetical protein [Nostoc]|uniref:Uncharacterized protein n=1 Tax=Nostoc paludosum FACHB-159 TaxID=2692908 RepID=A0ABR8KHG0_9NOSO|nr:MULTISPECIES: hypothetical protein [Nostoc]MBD2681141.1 hypothetical protein [Nostoc sp. FACHB-857]MBD2737618.1 hypothetical protein [Nostoc paludosum FACHB-159]
MTDLINSGSGNSSSAGDNPLRNSPFGRLSEVLSDEELSNLFSGVGNGENSGNPLGGGGDNLPYNGNPFAGDNFWNIFAGGVNPSAGGGGRDPLTGAGSQSTNISTTEIPDGFNLRVTIDNLVNSRLNEELGDDEIPSFDPSKIPSFDGGNGGQIPSFDPSKIPSFGGGNGEQIPSFDPSKIPSFGGGNGEQIPSFDPSQIPSFGGG